MDTSATTEKTLMESPVSRIRTGKLGKFQPNMYTQKYEIFTKLFRHEGWTFLRDDHHKYDDDYAFIVHDDCPKGVNIRPEGSVMHYDCLKCQQCNETPPDDMMAVYVLYKWNINDQFGVFDDGIIE